MFCGNLLCKKLNLSQFMLKPIFVTVMVIHSTSMSQILFNNNTFVQTTINSSLRISSCDSQSGKFFMQSTHSHIINYRYLLPVHAIRY